MTSENLTPQDALKKAVAQAAVDYTLARIDDNSIIGIGTGSTANFFIDYWQNTKQKLRVLWRALKLPLID